MILAPSRQLVCPNCRKPFAKPARRQRLRRTRYDPRDRFRPGLLNMAAGDTLLDADGKRLLRADGSKALDNGVDNSCCCGSGSGGGCLCTNLDTTTTPVDRFLLSIGGTTLNTSLTVCSGCTTADITATIGGDYCFTSADLVAGFSCSWFKLIAASGTLHCPDGDHTVTGLKLLVNFSGISGNFSFSLVAVTPDGDFELLAGVTVPNSVCSAPWSGDLTVTCGVDAGPTNSVTITLDAC